MSDFSSGPSQPESSEQAQNRIIENTLAGAYEFNIRNLFKLGWENSKYNLGTLLSASLLTLVIAVLIALIMVQATGTTAVTEIPPDTQFMMDLVITLITAPLMAGLMMMGVNTSIGKKVKTADLFHYLNKTPQLALAALMIALLVNLGISLLIIPGLYISLATNFTLMLIAEKKLRPGMAIILSVKVVNRYLFDFIKLYLLFIAMFFASFLTMGIGFIWTVPLFFNIKGILYRDLFGVIQANNPPRGGDKEESLFNA